MCLCWNWDCFEDKFKDKKDDKKEGAKENEEKKVDDLLDLTGQEAVAVLGLGLISMWERILVARC